MARSRGGSRSGGSRSRSGGSRSHSRTRIGGSSSSGSAYIFSRRKRTGCPKWLYYTRKGEPRMVWCNYDLAHRPKESSIPKLVALLQCFLVLGAVLPNLPAPVDIPVPISEDAYTEKQIIVDDKADVIENDIELEQGLHLFYETTGITPGVLTVEPEDWQYYDSLADFAYGHYYSYFNDEYHCLIVYSSADEWQYELMLGDNTFGALSDSRYDYMSEAMHRNLLVEEDVGTAIAKTCNDVVAEYKPKVNYITLFFSGIVCLFLLPFVLIGFGVANKRKQIKSAIPIPDEAEITQCQYCSGKVVSLVTKVCPHCNSVLIEDKPIVLVPKEGNSTEPTASGFDTAL